MTKAHGMRHTDGRLSLSRLRLKALLELLALERMFSRSFFLSSSSSFSFSFLIRLSSLHRGWRMPGLSRIQSFKNLPFSFLFPLKRVSHLGFSESKRPAPTKTCLQLLVLVT